MSFRSLLYALAKAIGDGNAIDKSRRQKSFKPIGRRVQRRIAGKITGRLLGRMFR